MENTEKQLSNDAVNNTAITSGNSNTVTVPSCYKNAGSPVRKISLLCEQGHRRTNEGTNKCTNICPHKLYMLYSRAARSHHSSNRLINTDNQLTESDCLLSVTAPAAMLRATAILSAINAVKKNFNYFK